MTGSAAYARDADVTAVARDRLDRTAWAVARLEAAQRSVLAEVIELWPTAAWLAAGASSAKRWLLAYTSLSYRDAARLERIAGVCAAHPGLTDAVVSGAMTLRRAEMLARAVTPERAGFLADSLPALLRLNTSTADDDSFAAAVRFWTERVDEQLAPRRVQPHSLTFAERLFGGGQIHGDLAPVAFATVRSAIDAWTQDPDPVDAPHVRTLSERRADALDDLAQFALTHDPDYTDPDSDDADPEGDGPRSTDLEPDRAVDRPEWESWDQLRAEDSFDGTYPGDDLDEALATLDPDRDADADDVDVDPLVLLRRRLRRAEEHRRRRIRRRVRARSGVVTNVHIDLRLLAGFEHIDDLDDFVLRGEGWNLTRAAAERLLCDSQFVATLFDGKTKVLDANEAAERFSRSQRRAIVARDGHCVFPSCTREPRHCDAHHLEHRAHDGPTRVDNGALLCRFHHRLVHEYGWRLLVDDTGHWVAVDAHGTHWTGRPAAVPPAGGPETRRPTHQDAS